MFRIGSHQLKTRFCAFLTGRLEIESRFTYKLAKFGKIRRSEFKATVRKMYVYHAARTNGYAAEVLGVG